jgi:hypothetical protein
VNDLQYTLHILVDVVIPESEDRITKILQSAIPRRVACCEFGAIVLPTINFNNKPRPAAFKVNNERIDRRLTPEMKPEFAKSSKLLPKHDLLTIHRPA